MEIEMCKFNLPLAVDIVDKIKKYSECENISFSLMIKKLIGIGIGMKSIVYVFGRDVEEAKLNKYFEKLCNVENDK